MTGLAQIADLLPLALLVLALLPVMIFALAMWWAVR